MHARGQPAALRLLCDFGATPTPRGGHKRPPLRGPRGLAASSFYYAGRALLARPRARANSTFHWTRPCPPRRPPAILLDRSGHCASKAAKARRRAGLTRRAGDGRGGGGLGGGVCRLGGV